MRSIPSLRAVAALSTLAALALAATAHAQAADPAAHEAHHPQPAASTAGAGEALLSEGEVRRIQPDSGKITLRHGPLVNLGMPAMTMVFTAADPRLLDGLKEGDKVRFTAARSATGGYQVVAIQPVH